MSFAMIYMFNLIILRLTGLIKRKAFGSYEVSDVKEGAALNFSLVLGVGIQDCLSLYMVVSCFLFVGFRLNFQYVRRYRRRNVL